MCYINSMNEALSAARFSFLFWPSPISLGGMVLAVCRLCSWPLSASARVMTWRQWHKVGGIWGSTPRSSGPSIQCVRDLVVLVCPGDRGLRLELSLCVQEFPDRRQVVRTAVQGWEMAQTHHCFPIQQQHHHYWKEHSTEDKLYLTSYQSGCS